MAILRLLQGRAFEPEVVNAMVAAFEDTLREFVNEKSRVNRSVGVRRINRFPRAGLGARTRILKKWRPGPRRSHQRLLQQNLPHPDIRRSRPRKARPPLRRDSCPNARTESGQPTSLQSPSPPSCTRIVEG